MVNKTISQAAPAGGSVTDAQVAEIVSQACPAKDYRGKKVLVIVPDGTRTAPVGLLFKTLHQQIGSVTKSFDVLVALGTHPPMSEAAICRRLEISEGERRAKFGEVRFFNHAWDNPAALTRVGVIPAAEISELTDGLFA